MFNFIIIRVTVLRQLAVVKILEANRRLNKKKNRKIQCASSPPPSELQTALSPVHLELTDALKVQTKYAALTLRNLKK